MSAAYTPPWPSDSAVPQGLPKRTAHHTGTPYLPRERPCGRHTPPAAGWGVGAQGWGGPASCHVEGHRISCHWAQPSVYGTYCVGVKDELNDGQLGPVKLEETRGAATLHSNTGSWSRAAPPPPPAVRRHPFLRLGCREHPPVYDNEHCLHAAKCPRGQNLWSAASDLKALSQ